MLSCYHQHGGQMFIYILLLIIPSSPFRWAWRLRHPRSPWTSRSTHSWRMANHSATFPEVTTIPASLRTTGRIDWRRLMLRDWTPSKCKWQAICGIGIGILALAAISGTTKLVPYHSVKSLQLIWRWGTCRFHLQVPHLQMSWSNLIMIRRYQDRSPSNYDCH